MKNTLYLYVFDSMSDWEIGYLTAELNSGRYFRKGLAPVQIVTVGLEKTQVITMGGLKITPDITVDECNITSVDALILPGGNTWTEDIHRPILKFAEMCLQEGIVVGAICGASIGLAQAGMLDSRSHTSNDLAYLKMICPSYTGEEYYKLDVAVTDGKLITASGVAPLEFSVHVLGALDVFSPETLDAWYRLNKTHEPQYFYALMNSIQ
ncbi:putative intracellular protease/amidase [Paenibacillus intestini]|uniref:Glutamine amidotransferase n=1 Tax=Paenibacillus cucumis (ex Kampfer et al. 2016) TaxID=1776858 RepID=A0ABS7KCU1_9BACL|nr:type 1 glutamine amidotransferase family protein [Paenibacillus cucumis (ex Kampfer et al. 2016)]MBY0201781.1 glutamine amidotransferase [Paenibacillus cucumis (ex Kampfer et al. 2016)]MDP9698786.1 putative intracellular protease/amidase [Paenibacillus intestini]